MTPHVVLQKRSALQVTLLTTGLANVDIISTLNSRKCEHSDKLGLSQANWWRLAFMHMVQSPPLLMRSLSLSYG